MKLNRWTAALAAAGVVTIPSLLQAQTNSILTALSSTTLSGYVDTSAQWNFGTGNANNPPVAFQSGKADGFNLNVVDVALDKPEDDSLWASGYHVELWFGPDANALGTQSTGTGADFAIRQAYVTLKTPVGNGIDWKLGVFDTIIGYESFSSPNNPNYTHSYGFTAEPGQHTGLLGTYTVNDSLSVSAGIADTLASSRINGRAPTESFKTYMAAITYTASTNAGWLGGSTLTAGVVNVFNNGSPAEGTPDKETSVYVGGTLSTPVTGLKLGASLDFEDLHNYQAVTGEGNDGSVWAAALYASFQATDKLALNLRGEWVDDRADLLANASDFNGNTAPSSGPSSFRAIAMTATAQYDLWKNVLSRVEFRWDHAESAHLFGGSVAGNSGGFPSRRNAFMLAANII